jgi:replicative DNA helicase
MAREITGGDFHGDANGRLFDSLVLLHDAGKPIGDARVLIPGLRELQVADWSAAEIVTLIGQGVANNAAHYAAQIRRQSLSRKPIDIGLELIQRAYDGADPSELTAEAITKLESAGGKERQEAVPSNNLIRRFYDPPWDSESVGLYEDLAAIAGRVLIPGGASGSPFPAGPRKAPIAS